MPGAGRLQGGLPLNSGAPRFPKCDIDTDMNTSIGMDIDTDIGIGIGMNIDTNINTNIGISIDIESNCMVNIRPLQGFLYPQIGSMHVL